MKNKHIIKTDANPKIPEGYDWTIESHKGMGDLDWDECNPTLYVSEKQKYGYIKGNDLQKELEDKPTLNANVLYYLLAHQKLIPEDWKGKYVYFWGTIYVNPHGSRCVLCLFFRFGEWGWDDGWLGGGFGVYDPSALLASSSSDLEPKSLEPKTSKTLTLKPSEPVKVTEIEWNNKRWRLIEEK